ncbi:MAG TPA: hypothetical protein VEC99_18550 [Clostridia bacterium]|nr:hypothetical protein [Clostridia bacterium]
MGLTFHRLIKRDLRTVMTHYEEEVGPDLAARFYREFEELALRIERSPGRFHFISDFRLHHRRGHHTFRAMFDTIRAEITTAADKLTHLRRFL